MPPFYVLQAKSERRTSLIKPSTVALLLCGTAFSTGLWLLRPGKPTYYLAMILWWCSVPLALLGWGSAGYVSRMTRKGGKAMFCVSCLLATIYLWATDLFALRRGTWHINVSRVPRQGHGLTEPLLTTALRALRCRFRRPRHCKSSQYPTCLWKRWFSSWSPTSCSSSHPLPSIVASP